MVGLAREPSRAENSSEFLKIILILIRDRPQKMLRLPYPELGGGRGVLSASIYLSCISSVRVRRLWSERDGVRERRVCVWGEGVCVCVVEGWIIDSSAHVTYVIDGSCGIWG